MRQIPIWELGWKFPDWDLSHSPKFGIFVRVFFKYPKISKIGNPLFFPVQNVKIYIVYLPAFPKIGQKKTNMSLEDYPQPGDLGWRLPDNLRKLK